MRPKFVAGNWKMNTDLAGSRKLSQSILAGVNDLPERLRIAICPPYPYLLPVGELIRPSRIELGAQNAYYAPPGAFTGEVALEMLVDVGCRWVILGHSERRQFLNETDEIINKKVQAALKHPLGVILCIGELLSERQARQTEEVLEKQLQGALEGVAAPDVLRIVIAYEPVWAIGTGISATPDQAQQAHAFIRGWLARKFGHSVADFVLIQYGGSVKPDNAQQILQQPDVDGALVGGASLQAESFLGILRQAAAVLTS